MTDTKLMTGPITRDYRNLGILAQDLADICTNLELPVHPVDLMLALFHEDDTKLEYYIEGAIRRIESVLRPYAYISAYYRTTVDYTKVADHSRDGILKLFKIDSKEPGYYFTSDSASFNLYRIDHDGAVKHILQDI